jgi:hypothetical protein
MQMSVKKQTGSPEDAKKTEIQEHPWPHRLPDSEANNRCVSTTISKRHCKKGRERMAEMPGVPLKVATPA